MCLARNTHTLEVAPEVQVICPDPLEEVQELGDILHALRMDTGHAHAHSFGMRSA